MYKTGKLLIILVIAGVFLLTACGSISHVSDPAPTLTQGPLITATPTPFITPGGIDRGSGAVVFSCDLTMSGATQDVELSAEGAEKIYYSLDGSVPDESSTLYTGPVRLIPRQNATCYVISARALYKDGTWSKNCVRSFLIGRNIERRYDCLVVSITTDPDNLWDYETGIFTSGKIMDDYLKAHPKAIIDGSTPANYNSLRGMDGEREAHLEMFLPDGSLVIDQDCGIRCYGGWSRQSDMKSVKLLARKEYGTSKFKYPFFETALDEKEEVVDVFKRLIVRAFGNDNGFAFIREELFQTLAIKAGYLGRSVRPCAVYINGEYYGAYFLEENWHKSYFENHFGEYKGKIEVLEGKELAVTTEDEDSKYAADDYNALYKDYAYRDLTDDAVYGELCGKIDVKNYLEYYAFRIFVGDEDWPNNNYKLYRYYAATGEQYSDAPFDGKWRYLLHDMDFSSGIYNDSYTGRSFSYYLGWLDGSKDSICPLFGRLMKRADCKEIFISKILELANGVFAVDYFNKAVDELNALRLNEQHFSYSSGKIAGWVREDQLEGRLGSLKKWMSKRSGFMYNNVIAFFQLKGLEYNLEVRVPDGSCVFVGNWKTESDFKGKYISDITLKVTGLGGINGNIVAWTVNGERVEGAELVLDSVSVTSETVVAEPVFEQN